VVVAELLGRRGIDIENTPETSPRHASGLCARLGEGELPLLVGPLHRWGVTINLNRTHVRKIARGSDTPPRGAPWGKDAKGPALGKLDVSEGPASVADMALVRLRRGEVFGYAMGSVGTGAFATVPGLLLAYYLTDALGVLAGVAALVVAVPKLWDVLVLPVVGSLSDAAMLRVGSRRPFLLVGGVTLPVCFVGMFSVPAGASPTVAAIWVLVAFMAAATAFAVFQVPYIAMPAEITDDVDERTTVMSWRVAVLSIAILLAGAGAPLVRDAVGGRAGYLAMGVAVATLIGVGMLACWWALRSTRVWQPATQTTALVESVRVAVRHRPFVVLLSAFVLQALATSAMLGAAQYVATYRLGDPSAITVLFLALVAPAILVMPLWARVSRERGKRAGFTLASLTFLAGTLGVLAAGLGNVLAGVTLAVAVCGVGYAGMQMYPLSMLPDTIAADTARSGQRRSGVFTGLWTAGETAGFALGPAIVLAVLSLGGFVSSQADQQVTQPDTAVSAILLAFTLVPAALVLISMPLVRAYRLPASVTDTDLEVSS
jgi:GPH family glycoside/pentoside/hexuronide:cation symporter